MNLSNSLGVRCGGEWGRVRSGLMFPSNILALRMCWYSMLQGKEGGKGETMEESPYVNLSNLTELVFGLEYF